MGNRLAEGNQAMTGSGSEGGNPAGIDARVTAALTDLGFSQYEARTYAGLIGREPMTGYASAKDTLVPQPKVYETLGRLVERGAVLQVSGSPAKFVAVPPARVLSQLETSFRQRMATVELEVSRMRRESPQDHEFRMYKESDSWISIVSVANDLISGATERIYVSGHGTYLDALGEEISAADRRGVRVDILCFGEPPFSLHNGIVIRHSSTDGTVYRHHQARHLAITCDTTAALWALAPEGDKWEAVWSDNDPLLTALVKGFVRHDIFTQRMFRDFSTEMRARYGAGLEGLFDRHLADPGEGMSQVAEGSETAERGRRRPA
jgi:HTH-type transcriptional regulator, sugar sensing transcriptional regulator